MEFKMKTENKEILAGVFLVLLLGICVMFLHARSVLNKKEAAFVLYAPFHQSDGLMNGAEVRIAGLKVGRVVEQTLNKNYQVIVKMEFFKPVEISIDSSVAIETDGLMGAKYLEIVPGGDEEMLKAGDEFEYTQDALILTELMEKVNAYMQAKKDKEKEAVKTDETAELTENVELNESEMNQ